MNLTKEAIMNIDLYTKAILTIIALSLVWLSVRDLPVASTAIAQARMPIYRGSMAVVIRGIDHQTGHNWDTLPVRIEESPKGSD